LVFEKIYSHKSLVDLGPDTNLEELKEIETVVEPMAVNVSEDTTDNKGNEHSLDSALKSMNFLAINVTTAFTNQASQLDASNLTSN
jgi:hypothetical protein